MNTFPSNIKQKFNSTIPDMADHLWPFTQKRYLRCGIYIISNNTIIYDYPKVAATPSRGGSARWV